MTDDERALRIRLARLLAEAARKMYSNAVRSYFDDPVIRRMMARRDEQDRR